ncbi:hypothetical protein COCMIDRAFT_109110, partial [Bipolaris oryzae ATCC 44560]
AIGLRGRAWLKGLYALFSLFELALEILDALLELLTSRVGGRRLEFSTVASGDKIVDPSLRFGALVIPHLDNLFMFCNLILQFSFGSL